MIYLGYVGLVVALASLIPLLGSRWATPSARMSTKEVQEVTGIFAAGVVLVLVGLLVP
jgi:hypothetical protein